MASIPVTKARAAAYFIFTVMSLSSSGRQTRNRGLNGVASYPGLLAPVFVACGTSPALVLQATNAGARRPGYEAINGVHGLLSCSVPNQHWHAPGSISSWSEGSRRNWGRRPMRLLTTTSNSTSRYLHLELVMECIARIHRIGLLTHQCEEGNRL